jgi:hypothetical protein
MFCLLSTQSSGQAQTKPEYERLYISGSYAKAADLLKGIVKNEPANPHAWNYLGLSLTKLSKEKKRYKAFEKAD